MSIEPQSTLFQEYLLELPARLPPARARRDIVTLLNTAPMYTGEKSKLVMIAVERKIGDVASVMRFEPR